VFRDSTPCLGESGNGGYLAKSDDDLDRFAAGGHLAQPDAAHHHPDARLDEVRAQPARLVYLAQGLEERKKITQCLDVKNKYLCDLGCLKKTSFVGRILHRSAFILEKNDPKKTEKSEEISYCEVLDVLF
jgi:hypothetical protein